MLGELRYSVTGMVRRSASLAGIDISGAAWDLGKIEKIFRH